VESKVSEIYKGSLTLANINMIIAGEVREMNDMDGRATIAKMTAEEITLKLGMKAKTSSVKCTMVMPLPI
jgi:hypothetical protein